MILRKLIFLLLALAALLPANAATHRLATYNIRYTANPGNSTDTEGKDWGQRGPVCRDVILNYDFDVVGIQEATGEGRSYRNPVTGRTQLDDLKAWLPDYELIAWDRDGSKRMEYVAIAFKKDRYDVIDQGSFFISATPDKVSNGWDTHIENHSRILGWLKLKDKSSNEIFIFACTHTNDGWSLDGPYGSQLVASRLKEIAGNLPVMVVADYNTSRIDRDRKGLKAYHAAFHDAALTVPADKNYSLPVSNRNIDWTYNAFNPVSNLSYTGKEIDFQFYRGMNILERHIVTEEFTYNGIQYPSSDHFPVFVVAELNSERIKTIYVDGKSANGDGTSTSPYPTISEAVAVAGIDDTILVAEGEYNESVKPGYSISIIGGYTDGFTKREGVTTINGKGLSTPPVYADANIDLTLDNLHISGYESPDSRMDGAIHFKGSNLTMRNLVVENNVAKEYGGGVCVFDYVSPKYCDSNNITASGCIFRNNSANYGGGMAIGFYDRLDIDRCSFENNEANKSASALYITFGAPESNRIWFTEAEALITNSSFTGNSSKGSGAVFINDDMPNVKTTIVNTTFAENRIDAKGGLPAVIKGYGGTAIHARLTSTPSDNPLKKVKDSKLYLGHVSVIGNHANCASPANFKASALNVEGGEFKLLNSIIAANTTNGTEAFADITVSDPGILSKETYNIITTTQTVNFSIDSKTKAAPTEEDGITFITGMMRGETSDGKFHPTVVSESGCTPFVPVDNTLFGSYESAVLTVLQRNLEREFSTDIDRDGTTGTQTKTDQRGKSRNEKSIPGAIEFDNEISGIDVPVVSDSSAVIFNPLPDGRLIVKANPPLGQIDVFDMSGSKVYSVHVSDRKFMIDLSSLGTGLYVIVCLGKPCKIYA